RWRDDGGHFGRAREVDGEGGAASFAAFDADAASGLAHDAVDGREPEAGAFANFFGGEEGFEDVRARGLGNAGAGVAYGEDDVVAGREVGDGRRGGHED